MAAIDERALLAALQGVLDPAAGKPLPLSGRIETLSLRDGVVHLALNASREEAASLEGMRLAADTALRMLAGVTDVRVVLAAHRPPAPQARETTAPGTQAGGTGGQAAGHAPISTGGRARNPAATLLPGVRRVIAVASGKGGVGKSTTAVNLAIGLSRLGLSVGLLDADIHGPSVPRMLGVSGPPKLHDGLMVPVEAWGLKTMSIGFLVEERTAMIWRGPMVMGALGQLLGEVDWGVLDILVVDMPPGTGDAQLTMAQKVPLAGAVIVSTPQDIALLDARRGVSMFEKTRVPVLGIVENMSFFCCPNCGARTDLFGHGGARDEADTLGVPFLGEIPLLLDIRSSADSGTPIMATAPQSDAGQAYMAVAGRVAAALRMKGPPSRILPG